MLSEKVLRYWRLLSVLVIAITSFIAMLLGYSWFSQGLISIYSFIVALSLGWGMVRSLRDGRLGVDILAILAIISTVAVGEYWATLVIVFMMLGGEALEEFANQRAKQELTDLLKRAPKIAHRQQSDGTFEDIAVDVIAIGDILLVKPGEVVPVDATVSEGEGLVDESSLTGESLPVEKKVGDHLLSGAVNGEVALTVTALRTVADSQYAQIVQLVKSAADSRAPFVRMADRYAVPFTVVSLVIGGVAWWLSGNPGRFAEVLVLATPCPLLIAAPVALISGMSRAAKHGIIVKNGGILERLANVQTIVFDKTGTLTTGKLNVDHVRPVEGVSEHELLRLAASADSSSAHILAASIVRHAKDQKIDLVEPDGIDEVAGKGLRAVVEGRNVIIGRKAFLEEQGIEVSVGRDVGATAMFVAYDDKFKGYISFSDTVRDNAGETIQKLGSMNITHLAMLTGDHYETAKMVGKTLGITDIKAECLPADKLKAVKTFQYKPVMMVGDGVNDAPVLAAADVGVAMGARGATAASESADVVIMLDDISRVSLSVGIAKTTIRIALQSVTVGIALSVLLMLIATSGKIPAVVGAGLQEVVDVIVILNALRAHGSWKRRAKLTYSKAAAA